MTHREKMQWLEENDPITYYELTSNPCGTDSSGSDFFTNVICFCIFIGLPLAILTWIFI